MAGVAFGLMSVAFVESTDLVHRWMARYVARPPLRPVVDRAVNAGVHVLVASERSGSATAMESVAIRGRVRTSAVMANICCRAQPRRSIARRLICAEIPHGWGL